MNGRNQSLSEQVRLQILQWIHSGWTDLAKDAFPSEAELADLFNTSRATVREALLQLERDRIVIRRQGVGTFINPALRKLKTTVNELMDPLEMIELQNCKAELGYSRSWFALAGTGTASTLQISAQDSVIQIEALYLADGRPAIWLEAALPKDELLPGNGPIPPFTSLAWFAKTVSGRAGTHSLTTIRALPAGPVIGERMGTKEDFPLIQFEDLYLTDHGRPAFLSRIFFRSDLINLQMLRNSYRISDRISIW